METEKIIKTLAETSRILSKLDNDEILEVLRCCLSKTYKDKEIIFKEDTVGDELYIIVSGSVVVKKEGKTIDIIRSGECFGEMAALSDEKRSATTEADGDILLLVISSEKLDSLSPEIRVKLLKNLLLITSERLRERIEDIVR
jgi:eukaryotic-like serine/threonine-protein kinase